MKLKSLILVTLSAGMLAGSTGCRMFGKSKKAKENATIAAGVESDFRTRWVERRTAELTNELHDAGAARMQAEKEFAEKYAYLQGDKK